MLRNCVRGVSVIPRVGGDVLLHFCSGKEDPCQ